MYIKKLEDNKILQYTEIRDEDVAEFFWEHPDRAIYVLDRNDNFYGIITLGDYLKSREANTDIVNTKSTYLQDVENSGEADDIFMKRPAIREIPVISKKGKMLCTICKEGNIERNIGTEQHITDIVECYAECIGKQIVFLSTPIIETVDIDAIYCVDSEVKKRLLEVRGIESYTFDELEKNALSFGLILRIVRCLTERNVRVVYTIRPSLLEESAYTERSILRIKNKLSFLKMAESVDENEEDLSDIVGARYSKDYVRNLMQVPQIVQRGKDYVHLDCNTELIHVTNGKRITTNQPSEYRTTIHMFGRCGVFGYAVEDKDTLPSLLQEAYMEKELDSIGTQITRVVNYGLWGADNEYILNHCMMEIDEIDENDIVVFYLKGVKGEHQAVLSNLGVDFIDTTYELHNKLNGREWFYDKPGHMGATGYQVVSGLIFDYLGNHKVSDKEKKDKTDTVLLNKMIELTVSRQGNKVDWNIEQYIAKTRKLLPPEIMYRNKKVGCIVMNCNPFTCGHRFLVEKSSKQVDFLIVFIVQEDKSFFKFEDRIMLVKRGVSDIKNVYVVPSGEYVLSSITFPEYFIKDQIANKEVDMSEDLYLFSNDIAPRLNISIRFIGTEPTDLITRQYNETMKKILPNHGIEVNEITRKAQGESIISASIVRRYLKEHKLEMIKDMVPESTYVFLEELNKEIQ